MNPSFWRGRAVLVTGASGLVGSHLVAALLRAGAEVTVLLHDRDSRSALARGGDLERVAVVNGSLDRIDDVERAIAESGCASVLHLGAQTVVGVGVTAPLLTFETNIRGTYNVLEACRRHVASVHGLIIASSDKAYGPSERPYVETDPLRARSPYDVSKAVGDLVAQSYVATYGLRLAILRCGNTYGGGDLNWSRIVPGTIRSFYLGQAPEIRSDGTPVRDYIYVSDVVEAYCAAAETLDRPGVAGEAFNIAAGAQTTVIELVQTIAELMGGALAEPRILGLAQDEIPEQRLNTDKARRVLGWAPKVALREGLRETIAWYRDYFGAGS